MDEVGAIESAAAATTSIDGAPRRLRNTATAAVIAMSPSMLTITPAEMASRPSRIRPAIETNSTGK